MAKTRKNASGNSDADETVRESDDTPTGVREDIDPAVEKEDASDFIGDDDAGLLPSALDQEPDGAEGFLDTDETVNVSEGSTPEDDDKPDHSETATVTVEGGEVHFDNETAIPDDLVRDDDRERTTAQDVLKAEVDTEEDEGRISSAEADEKRENIKKADQDFKPEDVNVTGDNGFRVADEEKFEKVFEFAPAEPPADGHEEPGVVSGDTVSGNSVNLDAWDQDRVVFEDRDPAVKSEIDEFALEQAVARAEEQYQEYVENSAVDTVDDADDLDRDPTDVDRTFVQRPDVTVTENAHFEPVSEEYPAKAQLGVHRPGGWDVQGTGLFAAANTIEDGIAAGPHAEALNPVRKVSPVQANEPQQLPATADAPVGETPAEKVNAADGDPRF